VTPGDPADHLNVAQSTGRALDVRLELVGGIVEAVMPLKLLFALCREERIGRPEAAGLDGFLQRVHEADRACQEPRFHQRRRHRDVRLRLLPALAHGPDTVTDLQADVPQ
jgi:hypothetical protein